MPTAPEAAAVFARLTSEDHDVVLRIIRELKNVGILPIANRGGKNRHDQLGADEIIAVAFAAALAPTAPIAAVADRVVELLRLKDHEDRLTTFGDNVASILDSFPAKWLRDHCKIEIFFKRNAGCLSARISLDEQATGSGQQHYHASAWGYEASGAVINSTLLTGKAVEAIALLVQSAAQDPE